LWPLSVPRSSSPPILGFEGESPLTCNDGYHKQHNGIDYSAVAGTAVYAGEDGIVKDKHYDSSGKWAYNIVLEHISPTGAKYTTVSWHVNPLVAKGDFVPKGMQIATVADLTPYGNRTHFHYGIRLGAYVQNVSGTGALPYATHPCDGYPVFPAGFVNPEDPTQVIFK
jgi:murein DD-endopeptidase MepM/ murein hydrolase activator NlpD